jgi:hypothetical protein
MADPVDLYYELHVQPLFSTSDRVQMLNKFDLWKYDDVRNPVNRDKILARLQLPADDISVMPPINYGGPWPQERIDLLKRWYDTGCKQLERATSTNITARRVQIAGSARIELVAQGQVPAPGYAVWLDQRPERATLFEFVLYQKSGGKFNSTFSTRIRFPDPGPALTSITVYDKNGPRDIVIS